MCLQDLLSLDLQFKPYVYINSAEDNLSFFLSDIKSD